MKSIYIICCPVSEAEAFRDENQLPRISQIPLVFGLRISQYQERNGNCYFFIQASESEAAKMTEALPGAKFA